MNAQSQSDNHCPKTMIVHWGSSRKIVHNRINYFQGQRLKSILVAVKQNFALNLLFQKIPAFVLNVIHLGLGRESEKGKNPDHVTSP